MRDLYGVYVPLVMIEAVLDASVKRLGPPKTKKEDDSAQ